MPAAGAPTIDGLYFKIVFFDFIYMLGEFLTALSELHVKIQLVDRYCSKVIHNLKLLDKQKGGEEQVREFIRKENRELLTGLERQNIFYDKYRLKLLRIGHMGTQGELVVEDTYNGSLYVVPVKRVMDTLLRHTYDSTPVQEMDLFPKEQAVMQLTSSMDARAGETAQKTLLELQDGARHVHVYVKKEKVASLEYLSAGKLVTDSQVIARAEAQETEKDRFLKEPLIRTLFPRAEATVS